LIVKIKQSPKNKIAVKCKFSIELTFLELALKIKFRGKKCHLLLKAGLVVLYVSAYNKVKSIK